MQRGATKTLSHIKPKINNPNETFSLLKLPLCDRNNLAILYFIGVGCNTAAAETRVYYWRVLTDGNNYNS